MALSSFTEVQEHFAELFGRAAALYNMNPLLGRLYGYLFLAPDLMTLDDLSRAAGAAKSTVSVAVRGLERYHLVRRQWVKGDRRDFFVVRTDTKEILQELFNLFFSPELKYMKEANNAARTALQTTEAVSDGSDDWPDSGQRQELLRRLEVLETFLNTISEWLGQILHSDDKAVHPAETIKIEVEE